MKKIKVESKGSALGEAMPDITEDESTEPMDYETKEHMETLLKSHDIMNDPVKLRAVHKLAGRHHKAIRGIQDLKDHYQAKYGPKESQKSTMKSELENRKRK